MSSSHRKQLARAIDSKLQAESLEVVASQLAAYVTENKSKNDLSSLLRDVMALRASRGELELNVTTAHELDLSQRASIDTFIKKQFKKFESYIVNYSVDPKIIGGFKIETSDKELDYTVESKINKFKSIASSSFGASR
jgi:F0F1-type ATP synthase delta subunit